MNLVCKSPNASPVRACSSPRTQDRGCGAEISFPRAAPERSARRSARPGLVSRPPRPRAGASQALRSTTSLGTNQAGFVRDAQEQPVVRRLLRMRLRTASSASSASLAGYLRRCGCIVAVIDRLIIEATAKPESFAAPHADIELEGYLKVWEAMHPEALLERLTELGRR
jgi:hypothetical protein